MSRNTSANTADADHAQPHEKTDEERQKRGVSLRPLAALKPYILKYPGMIALASTALVISALAMLVVPLAVRRMIDLGFGSHDGLFVDRYFAMLVVIGLILAIASAARFIS